jgi:hypothetical protein
MTEDPNELVRRLMMGIGGVVLYYASVEHSIDGLVMVLFQRVEGAAALNKNRHPTNAKEEIEFLRACLKELPPLSPFKQRMTFFLDEIGKIADLRHAIVHGHLKNATLETEDLVFARVRADGRNPVYTEVTITIAEIMRASVKLNTLLGLSREILNGLVDAFKPEEDRGEPFGPLGA